VIEGEDGAKGQQARAIYVSVGLENTVLPSKATRDSAIANTSVEGYHSRL
jgi:hypothetical protein